MNKRYHLRRLLVMLKPYWPAMLGAGFLSAATVLANVGLIGASAVLISWAALQPPILDLMMLIVAVRFFGISRAALRYTERYITHSITLRILSKLRVAVYQAIEPLMPAGLGRYSEGQLFSRLTEDIETLQYFYLQSVAAPLTAGLVLVSSSVFLGFFAPIAAMVLAVMLLVGGVAVPLAIHRSSARTAAALGRDKESLRVQLMDYIKGIGDLRSNAAAQLYRQRITERLTAVMNGRKRLSAWQNLTTNAITYLSHVALWLALAVTIPLVADGQLNGIFLAMVVLVVWTSFEAVISLPQTLIQMEQSQAAAAHVFELMDQGEMAAAGMPDSEPFPKEHTICFEQVDFAYTPGEPLYQQLNLTIKAGKQVALVGASGSGKSTLVNLLLGFWQPDGGRITIGNTPLERIDQAALRQGISVVDQSPYLFNATIRENLLLAHPEASDAALWQALERAQLAEFVRALPQGLETSVGESGMKLSGGQRQRIALARMFLRDGQIIILDEATQGLDTLTTAELLQEIHRWSANKTVITITHSLKGLALVDQIVVFQQGQIVERGQEAELLRQQGLYAQMYALERAQF